MKTKIQRIRLIEATPVGRAAMIEKHLGFDSRIDHGPIELSFDKDARFLRVTLADGTFELIPLGNVASILCKNEAAS